MLQNVTIMLDYIGGEVYFIPKDDPNREVFISAQIGDFVNVRIKGERHFGTISEKSLIHDDMEWLLIFHLIQERLEKITFKNYRVILLRHHNPNHQRGGAINDQPHCAQDTAHHPHRPKDQNSIRTSPFGTLQHDRM